MQAWHMTRLHMQLEHSLLVQKRVCALVLDGWVCSMAGVARSFFHSGLLLLTQPQVQEATTMYHQYVP
jgi:hypothetical protein